MTDQEQITLDQMVCSSVTDAYGMVYGLFHCEKPSDMEPFMKIVSAMRTMTPEMTEQVAKPIIHGILEGANISTKHPDAGQFADLIALSITDATNLIIRQMQEQAQHQAAAQQALAQGQGQLLRG